MQNVGQVTGKKRANVAAQNCKNKSSSVGGGGSGATASSSSSSNKNPNVGAAQTAPPPRVNDSESEDESVSEVKSTPFLVGSPNLKRPSVGRSVVDVRPSCVHSLAIRRIARLRRLPVRLQRGVFCRPEVVRPDSAWTIRVFRDDDEAGKERGE